MNKIRGCSSAANLKDVVTVLHGRITQTGKYEMHVRRSKKEPLNKFRYHLSYVVRLLFYSAMELLVCSASTMNSLYRFVFQNFFTFPMFNIAMPCSRVVLL